MKLSLSPYVIAALLTLSCKPATGPLVDGEAGAAAIEAGLPVINAACTILEGLDSSGTITTICATVNEVASIASFILDLRKATDAGTHFASASDCTAFPSSTVCASKIEIGKAIALLVQRRRALLTLDAGARP